MYLSHLWCISGKGYCDMETPLAWGLYPFSYRVVIDRILSQIRSYSFTFSLKDKGTPFFVPSVTWSLRTHRGSSIVNVFSKCLEKRCVQMLQPWGNRETLLCRRLNCFIFYITSPILELYLEVFITEQDFWTYTWKIYKMCDETLTAERKVMWWNQVQRQEYLTSLWLQRIQALYQQNLFLPYFPRDIF